MKIMRRSSLLAAVLATAFFVAGCGTAATTQPSSQTPAAAPAAKGPISLTIGLAADPPKLDPHLSSSLYDRQVFQSIFDKLVDTNVKGEIVPMLAEKWDVSADGQTYTFHLRQGVKFQDGTDFNAEAVKFNFDRMMGVLDPNFKSPRKSELAMVDKVTAVDAGTVQLHLTKPFAPLLSILSDRAGMMVSPAAVKQYGADFLNHPVGTGPFKFVERVKGDHVTLEKNTGYWQQGLPKADKVTYKILTDSSVAAAQVQAGQVDIYDGAPAAQLAQLKADKRVKVDEAVGQGYQGMWLNTTQPPFNNLKFRQAVAAAIDREQLIAAILGDAAVPAYSPFAPGSLGDDGVAPPKGDVNAAKKLLAESGVTNPSFTFMVGSGSTTLQQLGQVIQSMEAQVGIKVEIQQVEFGKLLDSLDNHQFQAGQLGWSGRPDPDQNIYSFFFTGASNNIAGYTDPAVDKLLDQARVQQTAADRKASYHTVLDKLRQDMPYIFLWFPKDIKLEVPGLQGYDHNPDGMIRTANLSK